MGTSNDSAEVRLLPSARETCVVDGHPFVSTAPVAPTRIGRYLIVEELGRGGMGVVWTAFDPKLDRKVAIKLLRSARDTPIHKARFLREAHALARLSHPNIVTIHDVDVHDEQLYMAMELVHGHTLEQWLSEGHTWQEVLDAFAQAGRGLAAAHDAGITHRDFKPSNVLIGDDGRVRVVDFGLAVGVDDESEPSPPATAPRPLDPRASDSDIMEVIEAAPRGRLTKVGRILGTPAYMAPEQYVPMGPHGIDDKTDQFSFAIALFEALYGRMPFEGADLYEIAEKVRSASIREPARDCPVPSFVFRVLQRALREDPNERYPSMSALLAALADDPARRRRRRLAALGGAALLAVASLGAVQLATEEPPAAPPVCRGAADRIAEVWNDRTRAAVEQGLMSIERPFAADTSRRVLTGVDEYADAWQQQHTEVCEATQLHGTQSEALLDVRMICLDRRRGELGALLEVLTRADEATVANAVEAVSGLRRPEPCASAEPGLETDLPADATRRAELRGLQQRLDDARALIAAGRYDEAHARASGLRADAGARGFERIQGEASKVEGEALRHLGRPEQARVRLRESIAIASEIGDASTELNAWVDLLYVTGVMLDDPPGAESLQLAAEGALRRNGSPRVKALSLALTLSAVMIEQRRLDEAARHGERAEQLATELDEPLLRARALNNLGVIAAKRADWSVAEHMLRRSHELKAQTLGAGHPDVIGNSMNLANVLVEVAAEATEPSRAEAALDEAERLYASLVAFREEQDGPHSGAVVRVLSMQGRLQRRRGRTDEARRIYEHVLQIVDDLPNAYQERLSALVNLAELERESQHLERAQLRYEQVLALKLEHHGEAHPSVATTRLALCRAHGEAGQQRPAKIQCTRVLEALRGNVDEESRELVTEARALLLELGPEEH